MLNNLRLILTILILFGLSAKGQTVDRFPSPDNKFEVIVEYKEVGDSNTEWVYHIVDHSSLDTLLLTTATTHDDPQPAVFWDKSSTRLIFEDRRDNLNPIRILELKNKTIVCSTSGFIGRPMNNFFDVSNNLLFFLRPHAYDRTEFGLFALDIQSNNVNAVKSLRTSGDPNSGIPWVDTLDTLNRTLTIVFEDKEYKQVSTELNY
jgi:hypothetical protein